MVELVLIPKQPFNFLKWPKEILEFLSFKSKLNYAGNTTYEIELFT